MNTESEHSEFLRYNHAMTCNAFQCGVRCVPRNLKGDRGSTMNRYTTEPWIAHGLAIRTPGIEDGTHEWLMQAACAEPSVNDYDNIKRAADCVNACKGMDNPKADIEALRCEVARLRAVLAVTTTATGGTTCK